MDCKDYRPCAGFSWKAKPREDPREQTRYVDSSTDGEYDQNDGYASSELEEIEPSPTSAKHIARRAQRSKKKKQSKKGHKKKQRKKQPCQRKVAYSSEDDFIVNSSSVESSDYGEGGTSISSNSNSSSDDRDQHSRPGASASKSKERVQIRRRQRRPKKELPLSMTEQKRMKAETIALLNWCRSNGLVSSKRSQRAGNKSFLSALMARVDDDDKAFASESQSTFSHGYYSEGDSQSSSSDEDEHEDEKAKPRNLIKVLDMVIRSKSARKIISSDKVRDQIDGRYTQGMRQLIRKNVGRLLRKHRLGKHKRRRPNFVIEKAMFHMSGLLERRKMGGQGRREHCHGLEVDETRNILIMETASRGMLDIRRMNVEERRRTGEAWDMTNGKLRVPERKKGLKLRTLKGYQMVQDAARGRRSGILVKHSSLPSLGKSCRNIQDKTVDEVLAAFRTAVCQICQKWRYRPARRVSLIWDDSDMTMWGDAEDSESEFDSKHKGRAKAKAEEDFFSDGSSSSSGSDSEITGVSAKRNRKSESRGKEKGKERGKEEEEGNKDGIIDLNACSSCGDCLACGNELALFLRAFGAYPLDKLELRDHELKDMLWLCSAVLHHFLSQADLLVNPVHKGLDRELYMYEDCIHEILESSPQKQLLLQGYDKFSTFRKNDARTRHRLGIDRSDSDSSESDVEERLLRNMINEEDGGSRSVRSEEVIIIESDVDDNQGQGSGTTMHAHQGTPTSSDLRLSQGEHFSSPNKEVPQYTAIESMRAGLYNIECLAQILEIGEKVKMWGGAHLTRNVVISDDGGRSTITFVVWDKDADRFPYRVKQWIRIKGAFTQEHSGDKPSGKSNQLVLRKAKKGYFLRCPDPILDE